MRSTPNPLLQPKLARGSLHYVGARAASRGYLAGWPGIPGLLCVFTGPLLGAFWGHTWGNLSRWHAARIRSDMRTCAAHPRSPFAWSLGPPCGVLLSPSRWLPGPLMGAWVPSGDSLGPLWGLHAALHGEPEDPRHWAPLGAMWLTARGAQQQYCLGGAAAARSNNGVWGRGRCNCRKQQRLRAGLLAS